jgi:hypothetical protein
MYSCRICGNTQTAKFLRLGSTPLANAFLTSDQLSQSEPRFPLDVVFCDQCGLVQLDYVVPPEIMFRDYIYVSSTSQTMPAHFGAYANEVVGRFMADATDMVVEMGSNDGCLLSAFVKQGRKVVGVEPAANLAAVANAARIPTVNDFFCKRSARVLLDREGPAKVIIGNNVLAHIGDLQDLVAGLDLLLRPDGIAVFEVPYLVDLLRKDEFDTVYHEHLSYFALRPLQKLFESRGMHIFDVKRVPVHGGSIRVYIGRDGSGEKVQTAVAELLNMEKAERLDILQTYQDLALRVERMKGELLARLRQFKAEGKKIAAYGAPAKGNTLLNHFGIGVDLIDFIVDRSPHKQGRFTPGTHIPVVGVDRLLQDQPDYTLLLAWNFADEVLAQQKTYLDRGGEFIVPVPWPRVLSSSDQVELVSELRS